MDLHFQIQRHICNEILVLVSLLQEVHICCFNTDFPFPVVCYYMFVHGHPLLYYLIVAKY